MNFKQHADAGEKLKRINLELLAIAAQVQESYGRTSSEYRSLLTITERLTIVRSELDDRVCRENLREADAIHCYFGAGVVPLR